MKYKKKMPATFYNTENCFWNKKKKLNYVRNVDKIICVYLIYGYIYNVS